MASKLSDAVLESEELKFTLMQKEIALTTMTKTFPELEKQVEALETEEKYRVQMNKEILHRSCSKRCHPSGTEKRLIDSLSNGFIDIAVQVEIDINKGAIRKCLSPGSTMKKTTGPGRGGGRLL